MLLIVGGAGQAPNLSSFQIQNLTIAAACLWSGGSSACMSFVSHSGEANYVVGNMGWTFVGEVSSQRLRARTAGLAAGISVLFGLTFNTSVPVMRMSFICTRSTIDTTELQSL
jgi:SP family sugar:H+ symporter-like MFS transporter